MADETLEDIFLFLSPAMTEEMLAGGIGKLEIHRVPYDEACELAGRKEYEGWMVFERSSINTTRRVYSRSNT